MIPQEKKIMDKQEWQLSIEELEYSACMMNAGS